MTDKWLEDIQNRMADFEAGEPDGLWDSIQSNLPQLEPERHNRTWAATLTWKKTAYSAAAAAAILFIAMIFAPLGNNDRTPVENIASKESPNADIQASPYKQEDEMEHSAIAKHHSNETPMACSITTAIASQKKECAPQPTTTDTIQAAPSTHEQETGKGKEQHSITKQYAQHEYYAHVKHTSTRQATEWSIGVYASGTPSYSTSTKSLSGIIVGTSPDDAEWNDSPMLGILLYNNGKEIETSVRHKLPVRIGLSLAHAINQRVSLETGITYTTLRSDIREGSNSHYVATEQKLQYIGIPLNIKIKALSWKQVDIYASAGLMAEKCFSGKIKTEYILDDKNEGSTTQKTGSLPYQVSANVGIGLQYNIDNAASLYVEPGVGYFFDDKSSIQTIYKEKPLNININAGFRISL